MRKRFGIGAEFGLRLRKENQNRPLSLGKINPRLTAPSRGRAARSEFGPFISSRNWALSVCGRPERLAHGFPNSAPETWLPRKGKRAARFGKQGTMRFYVSATSGFAGSPTRTAEPVGAAYPSQLITGLPGLQRRLAPWPAAPDRKVLLHEQTYADRRGPSRRNTGGHRQQRPG